LGVVRFFHIEHVAGARAEVVRLVETSRDGRIKLQPGWVAQRLASPRPTLTA
jgi:hypothetical protein